VLFIIAGVVFLGLYINQENEVSGLICATGCTQYAAIYQCGYQLCCDIYNFSYTYAYCDGIYTHGIYFIIFIVCFCYAGYEIILMVGTICRGSALQSTNADVIIINNNAGPYQPGYGNQGYGNQAYVNMANMNNGNMSNRPINGQNQGYNNQYNNQSYNNQGYNNQNNQGYNNQGNMNANANNLNPNVNLQVSPNAKMQQPLIS
jgi:hypothetical protein